MGHSRTATAAATPVESRWWYVIALVPLFGGTVLLFSMGLALSVILSSTTDFARFLPAFLSLSGMALGLLVSFPVALSRDAEAVRRTQSEWQPDGARYAALGVASALLTGFVATGPLSLYYLYKRRQHVGEP